MLIDCTIDHAGYLVTVSTHERLRSARWWHHVLLAMGNSVRIDVPLDELRMKAPLAALECIQAPGPGV